MRESSAQFSVSLIVKRRLRSGGKRLLHRTSRGLGQFRLRNEDVHEHLRQMGCLGLLPVLESVFNIKVMAGQSSSTTRVQAQLIGFEIFESGFLCPHVPMLIDLALNLGEAHAKDTGHNLHHVHILDIVAQWHNDLDRLTGPISATHQVLVVRQELALEVLESREELGSVALMSKIPQNSSCQSNKQSKVTIW